MRGKSMAIKMQILTVLLFAVLAGFGGGFLAGLIGHVDPARQDCLK